MYRFTSLSVIMLPILVLFWDCLNIFDEQEPLCFSPKQCDGFCHVVRPPVVEEHGKIHSTACVKNREASAHENTSQNKTKIGTTLRVWGYVLQGVSTRNLDNVNLACAQIEDVFLFVSFVKCLVHLFARSFARNGPAGGHKECGTHLGFVLGCIFMSRSPSVFHTSRSMDFTTSLYWGASPPV